MRRNLQLAGRILLATAVLTGSFVGTLWGIDAAERVAEIAAERAARAAAESVLGLGFNLKRGVEIFTSLPPNLTPAQRIHYGHCFFKCPGPTWRQPSTKPQSVWIVT